MAKKAKKYDYRSGLFPKREYTPSGLVRLESDPTRRIREGKSSIPDYEELYKGRSQRGTPPKIDWGDFARAVGVGFVDDISAESADELAGLLNAAVPGERVLGHKGDKRSVGFGDVRESQKAIRKLMDKYKHEYPGGDMLGRALSVLIAIKTMGGSTLAVPIAASLAKYGLKGTVKLANALSKAAQANPKILKLAKKPQEMIKEATKTIKKTPSIVKDLAINVGDVAVSETMASKEEGLKALQEGLTSPGTLVSGGLVVGPYTARATAGAAKTVVNRGVDLAKDWIPSLSRAKARVKLRVLGYSKESIDFIEKNKGFFEDGVNTNASTVLENFREFLEKAANANKQLGEMAMSKLQRNSRGFNKEPLIEAVNEQIFRLFKDPRYKPKFVDDPNADSVFDLDKLDFESFKKLIGPQKTTADTISSDSYIAIASSRSDDAKKAQKLKPVPRQGTGALARDWSINPAIKREALEKLKQEEIAELTAEKYPDIYKKVQERYKVPDEEMKLIDPGYKEYKKKEVDQYTMNGRFYHPKDSIIRQSEKYLEDYYRNSPDSGKLLKDLLELRESIIKTKGNPGAPSLISDVQLRRINNRVQDSAELSKSWADNNPNFKTDNSVNAYMAAHGQLSNKVNDMLGKYNPDYRDRWENVSAWNKATKGKERTSAAKSFNNLFGVQYEKTYVNGGPEYFITAKFEGDGEKTLAALEEALLVKSQPYFKEYQEAFKDFTNASLNSIREAKRYRKIDKKPEFDETKLSSENRFLEGAERRAAKKSKVTPEEAETFGAYRPYPDLMSEEIGEELRKNLATGRYYNASAANALMKKMLRGPHGEKVVELTGVGRLDEGQNANVIRKTLGRILGGGVKPFLYLAERKLKQKTSSAISIESLAKDAEEWNAKFESNPSKLLGMFKIPYELLINADKAASGIGRNVDNFGEAVFGEDKKIDIEPVMRSKERAPQSIMPPLKDSFKEAQFGEPMEPAPAVEKLAPQEFIEEETLEVENPEAKDRELRKDRVNAFLKQQGAYKRSKRRRQIG
jgi:hypothetical protein